MTQFYTNVVTKGGRLMHRGYDKHGKRVHESLTFRPTLFVPTKKEKTTSWSTIDGKRVEPIDFENMFEAREFVKKYSDVEGFTVYGDIDAQYQFIADTYGSEGELEYDSSTIRVLYIDIEVETESGFSTPDDPCERVNAITLYQNGKTHTFGLGQFSIEGVHCYCHTDEKSMLREFLDVWEILDPDIITGCTACPGCLYAQDVLIVEAEQLGDRVLDRLVELRRCNIAYSKRILGCLARVEWVMNGPGPGVWCPS